MLNPLPPYLGLQGAAYLMPFFLLGLASNRFADQLPRKPVMLLTAGLFAGTCLYLIVVAAALPYKASLPGLLIGSCCCVFLLRCNLEFRWLAWIGVHSFAIYLFHSMFSAASRIALLRLDVDATAYLFVAGLLAPSLRPRYCDRSSISATGYLANPPNRRARHDWRRLDRVERLFYSRTSFF